MTATAADRLDVASADDAIPLTRHFFGAVVTKSLGLSRDNVEKFLLIDGQQRLVTLTVLLAALRDVVKDTDPTQADRIRDSYLLNGYAAEPDRDKVLPTQADRAAYQAIVAQDRWTRRQIEERGRSLARQALALWPGDPAAPGEGSLLRLLDTGSADTKDLHEAVVGFRLCPEGQRRIGRENGAGGSGVQQHPLKAASSASIGELRLDKREALLNADSHGAGLTPIHRWTLISRASFAV